jgi:hypothetical protein
MGLIKRCVIVLTLSGVCCLAQNSSDAENESSGQVNTNYTITLTQPTSSFGLRSPIKIPMTIRNVTSGDIFWRAVWSSDQNAWYSGFRFLLTKDGKEVETTFFHRRISGRQRQGDPDEVDSGSTILLPEPSGIMFVMMVDLDRLYEIREPGLYNLVITRLAEDDKTIVRSNAVTLDIASPNR